LAARIAMGRRRVEEVFESDVRRGSCVKSEPDTPRWAVASALLWTACATLLRTIRWPNDWSEAHWLISYELGFLKRALPGSLIRPLLSFDALAPHAEGLIRVAGSLVCAVFCIALCWAGARILAASRYGVTMQLALVVFLTSPFFVMSAHLNGYFDHLILLTSMGACWLVIRGRVGAASIVVCSSLLVHESVLLIGYPAVVFAALLVHVREHEGEAVRTSLLDFARTHAVLVCAPLGVFLVLFAYQNFFVDPAALKARLLAHFDQFDFILRNKDAAVARAYSTPFSEYFDSEARFFSQRIRSRVYQLEVLPPVLLLLYGSWRCWRSRAHAWALMGVAVCITLLPLALHAVAFDTGRIWKYLIVVAALILWYAHEVSPPLESDGALEVAGYALLALPLIGAQIYGTTPLLDKQVERFDGFERTLLYAPTMVYAAVIVTRELWMRRRRPASGG
jgi:hypothetical protein